ncbi:MAG: hypothetical protein RLZZ623_1279, partial [Actinomycetota bacterium]
PVEGSPVSAAISAAAMSCKPFSDRLTIRQSRFPRMSTPYALHAAAQASLPSSPVDGSDDRSVLSPGRRMPSHTNCNGSGAGRSVVDDAMTGALVVDGADGPDDSTDGGTD